MSLKFSDMSGGNRKDSKIVAQYTVQKGEKIGEEKINWKGDILQSKIYASMLV